MNFKGRIAIIMLLLIGSMLFYAGYLFSLQIVKGTEYKKKAQQVARRMVPIPPQRGEIYDRNIDVPLAMNIDSFAVDIIPGELDEETFQNVANKLSGVLDMSPEAIKDSIPPEYANTHQPVEIKGGVSFETITYIAEHIGQFPGVTWHKKSIRSYTETGSISHVLGYVGDITREELQVLYNEGYSMRSVLGKLGIEKQYDRILRGSEGKRYTKVDVEGRNIEHEENEIAPELGENVVLTIDRHIQELCEKALGERIGSVVVLKPATGEIVSMVSCPWYNPNIFYTDGGTEKYRELSLDPDYPFLNRAIQSSYAPASMFKIVLTTAAIEEEAIPLDKTITCEGKIAYGDRVFHCHRKAGHGPLNLFSGLAESCNIFFWTLGREYLGAETIIDYAKRYGFGELTGIDLPGEVPGLVPSPKWKEKTYHSKWLGGDTMNMSIGQGYLSVTPIQVANMVAMVVNEGVVYQPHLVKEFRDPISGERTRRVEPEPLHTSAIRTSTFEKVKKAMRGVITDGTAKWVIDTKAVDIAGKTGTGQAGFEDRWNSWFTAYGPYQGSPEEQVVVVVMVEASNEWEWWAPKAANIIFQGIFADQNYEEAVASLDSWYLNER